MEMIIPQRQGVSEKIKVSNIHESTFWIQNISVERSVLVRGAGAWESRDACRERNLELGGKGREE